MRECKLFDSLYSYVQDTCDQFNFTIFHQNIRSINKNFDKLVAYLSTVDGKPDIIVLTEAWLSEDGDVARFTLPGYSVFAAGSQARSGGIVVFCHSTISISQHDSLIAGADSLFLKFKLQASNKSIALLCVYRLHGYSLDNFLVDFEKHLDDVKESDAICIGDFNIPLNDENDVLVDKYVQISSSFGFEHLIDIPTREASQNCIDHIMFRSKKYDNYCSGVINAKITDHHAICMSLPACCRSSTSADMIFTIDYNNLCSLLENENWSCVYDCNNVDDAFNMFVSVLQKAVDLSKSFKKKPTCRTRKLKPWITDGLVKSINIRDKIHQKMKKYPNNINLRNNFNKLQVKINKWVVETKNRYYENMFRTNANNTKQQWKLINELTGKSSPSRNSIQLENDEGLVADPIMVAQQFNSFFVNVPNTLSEFSDLSTGQYRQYKDQFKTKTNPNSIFWRPVCDDEVLKLINSLQNNKAPGPDQISTLIIKKNQLFLTPVLVFIFNLSLSEGQFPQSLKIAKVVPIFKGGSPLQVGNYRPISLLSVFSKLLEKIVKSRMLDFLAQTNFFSRDQYGFREGLNTECALENFLSQIYNSLNDLNSNKTAGLFLDLAKAFDTVNHKLLLRKLHRAGMRGVVLNWFESYLENRMQYVSVANCSSSTLLIKSGVPQGSVLGPILFLIFINDLYSGTFHGQITAFADDTAFSYSATNLTQLHYSMQQDLNSLSLWFNFNKLSLNYKKTTYLIFTFSNSSKFTQPLKYHKLDCPQDSHCSCGVLSQTEAVKYLGLKLDEDLLWKSHVKSIKQYLFVFLRKFYYLRSLCPDHVLRQLYFSFIHSKLNYGISCWCSTYLTHIRPVFITQKSFIRIITKHNRLSESLPLFRTLKILPLRYLYVFKVLNVFFKMTMNGGNVINCNQVRITRSCDNYRTPRANFTIFQKTFLYLGPKFYNIIPQELKNRKSLQSFATGLKDWLLALSHDEVERMFTIVS